MAALLARPEARHAALEVLKKLAPRSILPQVRPLLADPDPEVRNSALKIARDFADLEALPALSALAADPEEDIRWDARRMLGMLGPDAVLPELEALLADPDPAARARAASLIRFFPDVPQAFLENLRDPEGGVAEKTAERLDGAGRIPCRVLANLAAHPDPDVRRYAAELLARTGTPEDARALLPLLMDPATDDVAREGYWILKGGSDASRIFELAAGRYAMERENGAWLLGKLGGGRAVARLVELLADPQAVVAAEAIRSLVRLEAREAAGAIAGHLDRPGVVSEAMRAVAALGHVPSAEWFRRKAGEGWGTEFHACWAELAGPEDDAIVRASLAEEGKPVDLDGLIAYARRRGLEIPPDKAVHAILDMRWWHPNFGEEVRRFGPAADPGLEGVLSDPAANRHAAFQALAELRPDPSWMIPWLGDPQLRSTAAEHLQRRARDCVGALMEAAGHPDPRIRTQVASVLLDARIPEGTYLALAQLEDPSVEVRAEAARLLRPQETWSRRTSRGELYGESLESTASMTGLHRDLLPEAGSRLREIPFPGGFRGTWGDLEKELRGRHGLAIDGSCWGERFREWVAGESVSVGEKERLYSILDRHPFRAYATYVLDGGAIRFLRTPDAHRFWRDRLLAAATSRR